MITTDIPETDLVKIAERGVIETVRDWLALWREVPTGAVAIAARSVRLTDLQCEVLAAMGHDPS